MLLFHEPLNNSEMKYFKLYLKHLATYLFIICCIVSQKKIELETLLQRLLNFVVPPILISTASSACKYMSSATDCHLPLHARKYGLGY